MGKKKKRKYPSNRVAFRIFQSLNDNVDRFTDRLGERLGFTKDVRKRINDAFPLFEDVHRSPRGRWVDICYIAGRVYHLKVTMKTLKQAMMDEFNIHVEPLMRAWTTEQRERLNAYLVN